MFQILHQALLNRILEFLGNSKPSRVSSLFIKRQHHGIEVWTRPDLVDAHRSHCICYQCSLLDIASRDNCQVAQAVFELNVKYGLTTPVYECPEFTKS